MKLSIIRDEIKPRHSGVEHNSSKQINLIMRPKRNSLIPQLDAIKYARNSAAVIRCRY